jgi:4'-phosphopantetheinyl transferase
VPKAILPPDDAASRMHLPTGEVHLWQGTLDAEGGPLDESLLDAGERKHARALATKQLVSRFVRSRSALRRVLAGYLGVEPALLAFDKGAEGKPRLAPPRDAAAGGPFSPALRFNLSHSGAAWLAAVAADREVGVDVERLDRLVDIELVARRMFAPSELEALLRLEPDARQRSFLRCWAAREAVVKGLGVGLFTLKESFEIEMDPDRPLVLRGPAGFGWRIWSVPFSPAHVAVLATDGTPSRIRSWVLPGEGSSPR